MAQDRKNVRDLRPWYVRVRESQGQKERGLRNGYRSGLEESNAKFLAANGVPVLYETLKINYIVPESKHTYTPDFPLFDVIYVETKGKLENSDRVKHLLIKAQNPQYDIRFVFSRPTDAIYKGSPTSYAMWATKYGFKWAAKLIPVSWIEEAREKAAEIEKQKEQET